MANVEMNPPFSESTVHVAEDLVEAYKAAGWTEAKKASSRKSSDNK